MSVEHAPQYHFQQSGLSRHQIVLCDLLLKGNAQTGEEGLTLQAS